MKQTPFVRPLLLAGLSAVTALLAACASSYRAPPETGRPTPQAPAPVPALPAATLPQPALPAATLPAPAPAVAPPVAAIAPGTVIAPVTRLPSVSAAATALAYRRDAATHLYAHNAARIYRGMLKPHLYAIGVLDVDIDRNGQVTGVSWRRAPRHAPEVMEEIIRTVRRAAPYPLPARMGRVTYSDVWLWDKSGQFQLDTLTEGQM